MNLNLNYLADLFVFSNLKKISNGYLYLLDSNGNEHFFGDSKSSLKANIKINKASFSLNLLRKGSSGLGESYINNEFETDNLSGLIELTAKNIKIIHKFSGILDLLSIFAFIAPLLLA